MPEAESLTPPTRPPTSMDPDALGLLHEICAAVDRRIEVKPLLERVLELMAQRLGVLRGAITLLDQRTQELMIDIAHGLSPAQKQRGRYQLGEGIVGQVVQSGAPIALPRLSAASPFLNRTGALPASRLESTAFFCVPIKLEGEVLGALSIDLPAERANEAHLELLSIIATLIAQSVAARQLGGAHEEHLGFPNIIGRAKALNPVLEAIRTVADSDATVLIRGESGTGKELVADAIHNASPRRDRPLIKVNCAALPETVLESELFGHEQGAFTGAINRRKGRFELADGGTIFLDEIGDFSINTQITLLRILQEQTFHRVGGTEALSTDVRIIAATNRDLDALMAAGEFRQDLYYRLNVFPIHVPPLRERRTDIPLLADAFVQKHSKHVLRISTQAIDMLMAYHWPGNVRELENCIERAALLAKEGVIHSHHLPPTLQTAEATNTTSRGSLQNTLDAVERDLVDDALKTARGNMAKAARALGITERQMGLRVRRFRIDPARYKLSSG